MERVLFDKFYILRRIGEILEDTQDFWCGELYAESDSRMGTIFHFPNMAAILEIQNGRHFQQLNIENSTFHQFYSNLLYRMSLKRHIRITNVVICHISYI